MMKKKLIFLLISVLLATQISQAEALGKISGLVFMDYYYVANHHNENIEGKNGFWLRRVYFTYDHDLGSSFKIRFRLEGNSAGDFKSSTKIEPYIKDLYLEYDRKETSILLGLSVTPSLGKLVQYWGYRSVEKTALNLQKMAPARDFGLAIKGYAAGKKIYYHFMLANGEGLKEEVNKEKKVYAVVGFNPVNEAYFEIYGDYAPGSKGLYDVSTIQAFLAYKREKFRAGLQYAYQSHSGGDKDFNLQVASGFAVFCLREKINFFARLDRMFHPNPNGEKISYIPFDSTSPSTLLLAGFDFEVVNDFNLMPNLSYVTYDDISSSDLYLKLTAYFRW